MSHVPQRKEKDCLNCGATVQGRYCHVCGQENVVPKETFWHMVTHFFYDITHFDSNFFTTVKDLLFKPGFLSREYMKGRRASYLHPVRMYVFTSAIFFLLFFTFFSSSNVVKLDSNDPVTIKSKKAYIKKLETKLKKDTSNLLLKEKLKQALDTSYLLLKKDVLALDTGKGLEINFFNNRYKSFEEYDSIEKTLPASRRDGWLLRRWMKMGINIESKFRENPDEAAKKMGETVLHRLPYMLLISLPFFALILKLVYMRRKQFYYADHGVFTIHLYVFSFILLLIVFLLDELYGLTTWSFLETMQVILVVVMIAYLYIAMHNFYKQGWGKTFLKFFIVSLLSLIVMLILFVFLLLFSAVTL